MPSQRAGFRGEIRSCLSIAGAAYITCVELVELPSGCAVCLEMDNRSSRAVLDNFEGYAISTSYNISSWVEADNSRFRQVSGAAFSYGWGR